MCLNEENSSKPREDFKIYVRECGLQIGKKISFKRTEIIDKCTSSQKERITQNSENQ